MLTFKNDNWQTTRMLLQRSNCIVRRSVVAEDQLVFVLRNLVHFAPRIQQLNQKRSAVVSRYHYANIHTDSIHLSAFTRTGGSFESFSLARGSSFPARCYSVRARCYSVRRGLLLWQRARDQTADKSARDSDI